MLETKMGRSDLFDSVMFRGALAVPIFCGEKFKLEGEISISVPPIAPVPLSVIVRERAGVSLEMVSVPEHLSGVAGWKTIWIWQVPLTARVAGGCGQSFVWVKSPVIAMLLMCTAAGPMFNKVAVCGGLALPTSASPKETE